MVICLERGADLHMAQLMPLPLIVSCFSKIQIGFSFLVPAHLGSLGQRAVKRVCVCVCVHIDIGACWSLCVVQLFVSIDSTPTDLTTYTFPLHISIIDTRNSSSAPYTCQVRISHVL